MLVGYFIRGRPSLQVQSKPTTNSYPVILPDRYFPLPKYRRACLFRKARGEMGQLHRGIGCVGAGRMEIFDPRPA